MGISLIKTETGLIESQFFGERELSYEMIPGNNTPYYFGEKINPIRITLKLSPLEGEWTSELKDRVTMWLNNGKFNEFYSTDDKDRIYYLTYIGSPSLHRTGNHQGYIEVEFQNIDCYVRSQVYEDIFDFSNISGSTLLKTYNRGSNPLLYPKMWIEKVGRGDLIIRNRNDGNKEFKFTDLLNGENVYIDNKYKIIETDIPDRYIWNQFNNNYLQWVYGLNTLEITGKCKLKFNYRYEFLSH